jgi:N-acetylglucosamine-6-phosphate deacetylase
MPYCGDAYFGNQMTPLHHREIGMVGAGLLEADWLIEIICDKVHLSEDMLRLIYQLKQADKIDVITDSLAATGQRDGDYELGGMPVSVKGNEVRLMHNGHLAGSTLRMNVALKNVVEITGLPIEQVIQTTSYNQAISLGLKNTGKIEPGLVGDMVVLNKDFEVEMVFVDGK